MEMFVDRLCSRKIIR